MHDPANITTVEGMQKVVDDLLSQIPTAVVDATLKKAHVPSKCLEILFERDGPEETKVASCLHELLAKLPNFVVWVVNCYSGRTGFSLGLGDKTVDVSRTEDAGGKRYNVVTKGDVSTYGLGAAIVSFTSVAADLYALGIVYSYVKAYGAAGLKSLSWTASVLDANNNFGSHDFTIDFTADGKPATTRIEELFDEAFAAAKPAGGGAPKGQPIAVSAMFLGELMSRSPATNNRDIGANGLQMAGAFARAKAA